MRPVGAVITDVFKRRTAEPICGAPKESSTLSG
jgi:hypothetical protein